MPLFANAAPDPALLAQWVSVFMYLVGCAAGVVGLLVGVKALRKPAPPAMPQPLEVREHAAYATTAQVDTVKTELHGRMKRERQEIDAQILRATDSAQEQIHRVEKAASDRADKTDEKLDRNTEMTAATRGEVKLINQNVVQIQSSLNQFLQNQAAKKS